MGLKRKHKPASIPEKLKSAQSGELIQSVTILLQKFNKKEHNNEDNFNPERLIKTLIRGLGSSNIQVQKNYFATLVALMKSLPSLTVFSVNEILAAMDSELHISGSIGKGEEGEILLGRVLTFGVLVRSGTLTEASVEHQVTSVTRLLQDIKGKSYLPLTADPFLTEYLKQIEEPLFKKSIWPVLRQEVRPGPSQSLHVYHMLLVCEERFPSVVSTKFLTKTLNVPKVLCSATVPALLTVFKSDVKLKQIAHPACSDIVKYVTQEPGDVLQSFWLEVENQLLMEVTSNSNKPILAIKFFNLIISHLENPTQVLDLLTPKLLSWLMMKNKVFGHLKKHLTKTCNEALQNLCKLCLKPNHSKSVLSVIKKLLFDPGNIMFEQCSGTRTVQQLLTGLKEKSIVKLATNLQDVVTGNSTAVEQKDSETTSRPFTNKERLYSVHLFCKLLSLPPVQANIEWRLEQLKFLFDMGFFTTTNVGVELAGQIRESFFSCLNHKLPNLVHLRNILAGVVEHIDNRLNQGDQLRIKVTSEVMPAWKKMCETAKKIGVDKQHKHEKWVPSVFQTMFYHIGLHLFKEAAFATDVLQELHSVYQRVGGSADVEGEEPHWTEVVVEMFLSLLSRNSQLHRHLIGCIFSHFCPIMIPQNIHQILQILDPSSNANPLLSSLDPESESSSEDEESDGKSDNEDNNDEESSDDGMTEEEDEDQNEKVNDKLRMAVFEALGDNGAHTDVESVDLDDMDEEEAARVDAALSQAFRANRQARSKKQPSHAKALTNFRLRVLDLVQVWLASEPPLDLVVDTLLRLLSLLEHSLVDKHQAPLEARLRSVIIKLASTKKFNVSDSFPSLNLGTVLKSVLEKGSRTTTVYMSISKELTASALFLVKAENQLVNRAGEEQEETDVTVPSVLKEILDSFFLQRDCLLTVNLFEGLFKVNTPFICNLASKIPNYVFDPNVHPFRRSKALDFLVTFWKNNRILQESKEEHAGSLRKMSKRLHKGCLKMMEEPIGRIQPRFLGLLKQAYDQIRKNQWIADVDWPAHQKALAEFAKKHVTKPEKKLNGKDDKTDEMEVDNNEDSNTESEEEETKTVAEENEAQEDEEEEESDTKENNNRKDEESDEEEQNEEEDSSEEEEESEDRGGEENDNEEPPIKKKKSEKKKNHEKIKRVQLLKKNSRQMRLESMAVGLEENVFSKYNVLNSKTVSSPER